jgi:hypothetical protein
MHGVFVHPPHPLSPLQIVQYFRNVHALHMDGTPGVAQVRTRITVNHVSAIALPNRPIPCDTVLHQNGEVGGQGGEPVQLARSPLVLLQEETDEVRVHRPGRCVGGAGFVTVGLHCYELVEMGEHLLLRHGAWALVRPSSVSSLLHPAQHAPRLAQHHVGDALASRDSSVVVDNLQGNFSEHLLPVSKQRHVVSAPIRLSIVHCPHVVYTEGLEMTIHPLVELGVERDQVGDILPVHSYDCHVKSLQHVLQLLNLLRDQPHKVLSGEHHIVTKCPTLVEEAPHLCYVVEILDLLAVLYLVGVLASHGFDAVSASQHRLY